MRTCAVLLLTVLVASVAPSAGAQEPGDRESARQHYERGMELVRAQSYEAAIDELRAAYALAPHWTVLYNIGQAYIALVRPVEALAALEQCLEQGKAELPAERVALIQRQIDAQRAQTAELRIEVSSPDAAIELDDVLVGRSPAEKPLRVSPGTHRLKVTAPDGAVVTQTLNVAAGQGIDVPIRLPAAAPTPTESANVEPPRPSPPANLYSGPPAPIQDRPRDHPARVLAYVLTGAGVALGAAAIGHYAWNRGRFERWRTENAALSAEFVAGDYQARQHSNNELAASIDRAEWVTVGLTVAAGACVVGGVSLFFVGGSRTPTHGATGSRFIGIRGEW